MKMVPYAVFGLMAALLSRTGFNVFIGLGYYIVVVSLGLLVLFVFYLILYYLILKKNPFHFILNIKEPLLLAFSTASSAAVMPLSIKVAEDKLNIEPDKTNFVIPLGATINMDGTALYQCITVMFLAQIYGIDFSIFNIVVLTFTIVAASIGTPAIPGGGVIILSSVLQSSGIPIDGLVLIIGIDRILGMLRTAVNVTGDLTAVSIFDKLFSYSKR
jgi:Na+/H+-dicarboxylate symporter